MTTDWNGLVGEYGPLVFRTAWRILGQAADAEDVVQDVFLEAHQLAHPPANGHWGGMLYRMATFRAVDRLRRRKPSEPVDDASLPGDRHRPEDEAIGHELAERLRQAIAELPEREASVFCLRYFEELSYREIADALGISVAAVATALHKARAKLQTALSDDEER